MPTCDPTINTKPWGWLAHPGTNLQEGFVRLPTALVSSAVAGALTLTVSGCSSSSSTPAMDHNATPMPGMSATTSMSAALAGRAGDVMFAQMMIPHHQQAIEMADIALGKPSASAKVRELATQIKAAQDPEITLMSGWLTSWGASTATAGGMGQSDGFGHDERHRPDRLEGGPGR